MTVEELDQWRREKRPHYLLDVREQSEYASSRIEGSQLIPLLQLQSNLKHLPKDQPIVVYCQSGGRSMMAVGMLGCRALTPETSRAEFGLGKQGKVRSQKSEVRSRHALYPPCFVPSGTHDDQSVWWSNLASQLTNNKLKMQTDGSRRQMPIRGSGPFTIAGLDARSLVRTAALCAVGIGALWVVGVVVTGGFSLSVGSRTFSSHEPMRPLYWTTLPLALFVWANGSGADCASVLGVDRAD